MNKVPLAVGPMARPKGFLGGAWKSLSQWNYIAIGAAWINGFLWYVLLEEFDASEIRVSKLFFEVFSVGPRLYSAISKNLRL